MNSNTIDSIITQSTAEMGILLPPQAAAVFGLYYRILAERGKSFNLTALTSVEDVAHLHFLDSLALTLAFDFKGKNVIDIGSGAGFPGLPLKIADPSICLTMLDATKKRTDFLLELCAALNIKASCVHARAETAAHDAGMREHYDAAVSRAVARLNILCELCLPFIRVGGAFLAMKSTGSEDETGQAHTAIEALGAKLSGMYDYDIPNTSIRHRVVIIRKISHTPPVYPRRFALIKKKPI